MPLFIERSLSWQEDEEANLVPLGDSIWEITKVLTKAEWIPRTTGLSAPGAQPSCHGPSWAVLQDLGCTGWNPQEEPQGHLHRVYLKG